MDKKKAIYQKPLVESYGTLEKITKAGGSSNQSDSLNYFES